MIIDKAAIKLDSQHQLQKQTERSESLRIVQNPPPRVQPRVAVEDRLSLATDKLPATQSRHIDPEKSLSHMDNLTFQIIRRMVREITGVDFKLFSPEELQDQAGDIVVEQPLQPPTANPDSGVGLIYQRSTSYYESETLQFSAEGSITTKDGRSIDFSMSLSMSRTFYQESNLEIRAGDAAKKVDPIVINFDGTAAELTTTRFEFDIDANGSLDQVALFKSNSGFLALDKNQDGQINDGSELFGPASGNGFKELSAYDDDRNQFIDEGDAIYQKLRIWQRHADGSQQLAALGERNIGAIYLGHATSPFQITDANNQALGEVASSGIYISEDGKVGSVQHVDFAI